MAQDECSNSSGGDVYSSGKTHWEAEEEPSGQGPAVCLLPAVPGKQGTQPLMEKAPLGREEACV